MPVPILLNLINFGLEWLITVIVTLDPNRNILGISAMYEKRI